MTIPNYKELQDKIKALEDMNEVLEGKLEFWSNLSRLEPADSIKKAMEEAIEWNDERMDIIGQNGNDGLHYNEDKDGM